MKTMNHLILIALALFSGACTSDNQSSIEELKETTLKSGENQEQEVFNLDLKQYFLLNNIENLENNKRELVEQIEGGNEELLPELESVIDQLRNYRATLENILEKTCLLLKMRFEVLTLQAEEGNSEAIDELLKLQDKLEKCGIGVEEYLSGLFEGHPVMFAMSIGSRCSPGREWKCKNIMNKGRLLINVEEELAERTEARFKTGSGEVIGTGRLIGEHQNLNGIMQIELQLEENVEGILEIRTGDDFVEVPIEVQ